MKEQKLHKHVLVFLIRNSSCFLSCSVNFSPVTSEGISIHRFSDTLESFPEMHTESLIERMSSHFTEKWGQARRIGKTRNSGAEVQGPFVKLP